MDTPHEDGRAGKLPEPEYGNDTCLSRTEEMLRNSEEKYRRLVEMSPDVIFELKVFRTDVTTEEKERVLSLIEEVRRAPECEIDAVCNRIIPDLMPYIDGSIVYVNQSVTAHLGYTPEQVRSKSFSHLIVPEDRERAVLNTIKILSHQVHHGIEYEVMRDDGSRVRASINSCLADRRYPFIVEGVARNITHQRETEEALQKSEHRFRSIFDSVPMSIWEYDFSGLRGQLEYLQSQHISDYRKYLDEHPEFLREIISQIRMSDVNRETLRLYGAASKDDIMGPYSAHHIPEAVNVYRDAMVAYLEGKSHFTCETVNETVDGRRIDIIIRMSFHHDDETSARALLSVTDITELKKAERALRENEAALRSVFNAAPVGITFSKDRVLISVNDSFCEALGYTEQELIGQNVRMLYFTDREYENAGHELYSGVLKNGRASVEARMKKKDGSEINVILNGGVLHAESPSHGFVVTVQDITERKKLEEQFRQSQKMESVGRLAGGVAHDFNNILTAIIGNSELLLMTLSPEGPVYSDISEIKKSAERAANLTRQLLAFSRKQIISPKILNLNDIILDMERMLRRIIGEHIEYLTVTCPDLHPVSIDPGQLEQVLTNLVVNSRDSMPRGGKLTIETANVFLDKSFARSHPEAIPGDYVMLGVSDTGVGMNKTVLKNLFEPFFTTKPRGSGTGLGLSTCYGIVQQNKGFISVYSEPGRGTTMKVYLPAVSDKHVKSADHPDRELSLQGKETILVAEDEPLVQSMIARVLQDRGYTVLTANNGQEALEVFDLNTRTIHALITDIVMPRMGGKELSEGVLSRCPSTRVLFMSGYTDNAIVHQGILDPGVEFIQKPFSPLELTKKVRLLLDRE